MNPWIAIPGAILLMFRVWLVFFKLPDELQFRNYYLSRILNIIFFFDMALGLEVDVLNLGFMLIWPILLVSILGWDSLFFYKFKRRTYWEKNHGWLIVERLTLHLPMFAWGSYMLFTDYTQYLYKDLVALVVVYILFLGPMVLFDKRWTERYIWPTARDIVVSGHIVLLVYLVYCLWPGA